MARFSIRKRIELNVTWQCSNVVISMLFCDHVASLKRNFHGAEMSSVHRTQKDGSKLELPCPVAVRDYNQNMGGVD